MGERGTGVDGVDGVDEEASTTAHHLSMTFAGWPVVRCLREIYGRTMRTRPRPDRVMERDELFRNRI